MALGDNVDAVLGPAILGCSKGNRDGDVVTDFAHDAVDGRVYAEGFTDDCVHERQIAEFIICQVAEAAVWCSEIFDLFLIQSISL